MPYGAYAGEWVKKNIKFLHLMIVKGQRFKKILVGNWRASVASETLTGVTQSKIGDVCLFIYIYGRTYVILYFDPRVFVLVMWSTPSQIALNRILWFIDQYPYHPRN